MSFHALLLLLHLRFDNIQRDVPTHIPGAYANTYIELEESSVDTNDKIRMYRQGAECSKTDIEGYEISVNIS